MIAHCMDKPTRGHTYKHGLSILELAVEELMDRGERREEEEFS